MFNNDKLVRHKEFGLGIISENPEIIIDALWVYFSSGKEWVQKSELTETNVKIDRCFRIHDKTFFNLHDVEKYAHKREYANEISKFCHDNCPIGSAYTQLENFITENAEELRTILNKYKHL